MASLGRRLTSASLIVFRFGLAMTVSRFRLAMTVSAKFSLKLSIGLSDYRETQEDLVALRDRRPRRLWGAPELCGLGFKVLT